MNKPHCNYIIESEAAGGRYRWCVRKRGHFNVKSSLHLYNVTDELRLKFTKVRKDSERRIKNGKKEDTT